MQSYVDMDWYETTSSLSIAFYKRARIEESAVKEIWLQHEAQVPWEVTTGKYKTSIPWKGAWHPSVCGGERQPSREEGVMVNELCFKWGTPFYVRSSEMNAFRNRSLVVAGLVRDELSDVKEVRVDVLFRGVVVRI